jgi:NAD(P)-dependent dehydrogenase (short-subunit alcohol dehydrogenase family)
VISVLGVATLPQCAAYTASKAAIIGLIGAVALEVGRDGIRANCILP